MIRFKEGWSNGTGAGTGTSLSVTLSSNIKANDFCLVVHSRASGVAPTAGPTGYTLLAGVNNGSSSNYFSVYYKALTAADASSTLTVTGASSRLEMAAVVYSGVSGLNVNSTVVANSTTTTSPTITGITTTVDRAMVVGLMTSRVASGTPAMTPPTGWTERIEACTTQSVNTSVYAIDLLQTNKGAVSNAVATASVAIAPMSIMVSLTPVPYRGWGIEL